MGRAIVYIHHFLGKRTPYAGGPKTRTDCGPGQGRPADSLHMYSRVRPGKVRQARALSASSAYPVRLANTLFIDNRYLQMPGNICRYLQMPTDIESLQISEACRYLQDRSDRTLKPEL